MSSSSSKIGVVPYINAIPLYHGLPYPIQKEVPSRLVGMLKSGELDIALIPVFAYFQNPDFFPLFEAGVIQSIGPVESVCLFYDQNLSSPKDITSLSITTDSVTSVNLFKVIYSRFWQKDFSSLVLDPQSPNRLEIGDKALFNAPKDKKVLDLGDEWTKNTGLPFVYAIWAHRGNADPEVTNHLINAKKNGVANREALAKTLTHLPQEKVLHYLTKSIHYEITLPAMQGLKKFQDYCFELGLLKEKRALLGIGGKI